MCFKQLELTMTTCQNELLKLYLKDAPGFWYKQPVFSFTRPPTRRFFNGSVASRFRCDRSCTDRNTRSTLARAQGQCDDLKSDLPAGEKRRKKEKRKSQRCACVCSNPADQSSDGGLTPPTNHVRVPLQVITCAFKETKRGRNISRSLLFSFQSCPCH